MATTEKKKFKMKLFKVARELNVSTDRVVQFLEEEGYGEALSGDGFNASITDEEAYLVLREEYADDAQAAARIRELRAEEEAEHEEDAAPVQTNGAESTAEVEATAEEAEDVAEEPVAEEPAAEEPEEDAVAEVAEEEEPAVAEADTEALATEESAAEAEQTDEVTDTEEPVLAEADADVEEVEAQADAEVTAPEASDAEAVAAEEPQAEEDDAVAEEAVAEAPEEAASEAAEPEAAEPEVAEPEAVEAEAADAVAEEDTVEADADEDTADATLEADEVEAVQADEDEELAELTAEEREALAELEGEDDEDEGDDSTIRANRHRLSGTQVVGKVDLSQLRRPKRKRKRKDKDTSDEEDREEKSRRRKDRKQKKQKKQKRRSRQPSVDEEDVEQTIQETLQELEQGASRARQRRRRRRRQRHEAEREAEAERRRERESVLRVTEFISTGELANLMGEPVSDVIGTLFESGMMVSINQRLDADTIEFIADEYDMDVEFISEFSDGSIEVRQDRPEDLKSRAPVVTVMGHVDHGKTSLLDYIRHTNVVAGEEGGITQHIGAHQVKLTDQEGSITFLDTPGHEAFTAMRARGAKATDIVILVVAADDAVMPQTIEAINHAQAADVPIVVAINKIDKDEADPNRVMTELAEQNVLVEEFGGNVQVSRVSAKTGEGIEDLLEKVLLQAELLELQANPDREADGVIIESRLEKGRGNVITVLVQNGTLKVGDPFIAGIYSGRIRAMFDERDQRIEEVGPSEPALILGTNGSPEVGDQFIVLEDESEAREIAQNRQRIHREQELRRKSQLSLDQIGRRLAEGEFHELNLIVKADVGGSVEALADALLKIKTDEVAVRIIHSGVGAVTESDVMLARASEAVIIGFQVRPTSGARDAAEREEVDIRTYSVIYDAIEDVHDALEGLLSPERRDETKGYAEVRETFKVPGVGTIGGCRVTEGTIHRNHQVRVIRDGVVIYESVLGSLKRFQDDVREVQAGYECGLSIENFDDIKVGDEIESYVVVEEKRKLEV